MPFASFGNLLAHLPILLAPVAVVAIPPVEGLAVIFGATVGFGAAKSFCPPGAPAGAPVGFGPPNNGFVSCSCWCEHEGEQRF